MRRLWVWCAGLVAIGVVGCAAPAGKLGPIDGRFDGTYVGTRVQDPACGTESQGIKFEVLGRQIAVQSRRRTRRLDGSVDVNGNSSMTDPKAQRQVVGTLADGKLEASETVAGSGGHWHRSEPDDPMAQPCVWRFSATRLTAN